MALLWLNKNALDALAIIWADFDALCGFQFGAFARFNLVVVYSRC